jgi:hypothetical protein
MKTTSHAREVVAFINSVEDKDIQNEMLDISSNYSQALAGLRLAKNFLTKIDDETGTDHEELFVQITDLLESIKHSEISMLEIVANW